MAERRRQRRRVFSDAELLQRLREAVELAGGPLTTREFAHALAGSSAGPVPSAATIAQRFGSWPAALAAAGAPPERRRSRRPVPPERRAQLVAALQRAARHGACDSRAAYRDHQARHPAAPTLAEIEHAFHSWPEAVAAAGLPAPRRGPNLSDELLLGSLAAAAHALGRATLAPSEYDAHRTARPADRLPSVVAIARRFGSWDAALMRAGLLPSPGQARSRTTLAAVRGLRLFAAVRPSAQLSAEAYDRFRDEVDPSLAPSGEVAALCGGWNRALERAGLDPRRRFGEVLDAALVAAAAALGGQSVPVERYKRLSAAHPRLPSYRTFYRHHGNWGTALRHAGVI
jgi:hypothetical protein